MTRRFILASGFFIILVFLTGCGAKIVIIVTATPPPTATIAPTSTLIPTDTLMPDTPTPSSTPTPASVQLWLSPSTPPELRTALDPLIVSGRYSLVDDEGVAAIKMAKSGALPVAKWIYAPVMPFPTIPDNLSWADFHSFWGGSPTALSTLTVDSKPPTLVASDSTIAWLTELLGTPSPTVKIQPMRPEGISAALWSHRGTTLAIMPFHQLDPALKVLTIDNMSIFDRGLNLDKYPLTQSVMIGGDSQLAAAFADALHTNDHWMPTNRDQSKMTILVMTGVTTMARAVAYTMETTGITLPARDILPFLQDADFVHTSNETAFATDCPYPNPAYTSANLQFCSRDSYFDLLKAAHINIMELTGNHVDDWGTTAFNHTLDLYDQNKLPYFGGGRDDQDARKPLLVSHNGQIIAFIGCNPVGPDFDWAAPGHPGAAKCDDDYLSTEIPYLKTVANIVIMDIQYQEYYEYDTPDDQVAFFKKYTDLGADIVLGTQAHQPQGFAFTQNTFIHYGLGNLFFDQMDDIATRQMFADKLILYKGKHISTVLFTGIIEDYSRPRPMTPDERSAFLKMMFGYSGWK